MKENMKENNMDGLGYSDIGKLGLLYNGYGGIGVGGRGFGADVIAAGAFADGTGVGENVKCNRDIYALGQANMTDRFEDGRRSNEFNRLCDRVADLQRDVANNNLFAQQRASDAALKAQECCCETQKAIAECCCTTQKEIAASENRLTVLLKDQQLAEQARDLDACRDNANTQTILGAIQQQTGVLSNLANSIAQLCGCNGGS